MVFHLRSRAARSAAVVAAALAAAPNAPVWADINGFTSGGGTAANQYTLNRNAAGEPAGVPSIDAATNTLLLTPNAGGVGTSAFYNTAQAYANWVATFTYQKGAGSANPADGFAFVLQNDPRGTAALGGSGGGLGYREGTPISNSAAVGFDLYNGSNNNPTRTGLATNGGGFAYTNTTPVNLKAGNPVNITLSYRDGIINQTITDPTASATFSNVYPVNLSTVLGGGGNAFVGFTGGTGGETAEQRVRNFTFTTGNAPPPALPVFNIPAGPAGGQGTMGIREIQGNPNQPNVGSQQDAYNSLANPAGRIADYQAARLNLHDSDGTGNYQNDARFQVTQQSGGPAVGGVDNLALAAKGTLRIAAGQGGTYTFGVNSDDGFTILFPGRNFTQATNGELAPFQQGTALRFFGGRGASNTLGQIDLPAGDHPFVLTYHEGAGGSSVEFFGSKGARTAFDGQVFSLVGSPAVPEARQTRARYTGTVRSPGFTVIRVTNPDGATDADRLGTVLNTLSSYRMDPANNPVDANGTSNVINFNDTTGTGGAGNPRTSPNIPGTTTPPGDTAANDDNFGLGAFATLNIASGRTGRYTFDVHSDDQSILRVLSPADADGNRTLVPLVSTNRTAVDTDGDGINDAHRLDGSGVDSFGRYDLTAAGDYVVEVAMREGGGGSHFQLFGAIGDFNEFNDNFQLVGQNFNDSLEVISQPFKASLELVPEPGSIGLAGLAALGLLARRRRPGGLAR